MPDGELGDGAISTVGKKPRRRKKGFRSHPRHERRAERRLLIPGYPKKREKKIFVW